MTFLERPYWQALLGFSVTSLLAIIIYVVADAIGHRYPFFTFFPAILFAARFGGLIGGTVATVTAMVLLWLFWLQQELQVETHVTVVASAVFVGMGLAITYIYARLARRERELQKLVVREAEKAAELKQLMEKEAAEAAELALTLKKLQASETARDDFISNLSHELRTPLNVVLGYARMIAMGHADQAVRLAAVIERNAKVQLRLVEDLLDMKRIDTGRFTLERITFDFSMIGPALKESLQPLVEAKGVHFTIEIEPMLIEGDPARLQQACWNLLNNAVKFTPAGGHIALAATCENSHALIQVQDTGEGIPPHFLPFVFERFKQLHSTPARRHQGMGLGLTIVKEVVESHGGTVHVTSKGVGQGTLFSITLPNAVCIEKEWAKPPLQDAPLGTDTEKESLSS